MSRDYDASILDVIYARETGEAELYLLTIDHADMVAPVRLVSNHEDVTSRGDTYSDWAFDIPIVAEEEGQLPRVELVIDNVTQSLIATIRSIDSPPTITFETVFASDPDTVIAGPWDFAMREVRHNARTIRASLQFEPLLDEPYPTGRFTPLDFPGLFNAVAR